jgi:hypothetical protein
VKSNLDSIPFGSRRLHTARRPLRRLMTRTTSATTSSKWIRPPATCRLKPKSHRMRSTTKIVQSMFYLLCSQHNHLASCRTNRTSASELPHSRQNALERGVINPQNGHILCVRTSPACGVMILRSAPNRSARKASRLRNGRKSESISTPSLLSQWPANQAPANQP